MGAVNTTYTFTATDTITSTKMNNIIDETVMTTDSVLDSGGLVIASGKLAIGSGSINSSRLAAGAVSNTNVSDTAAIAGTKITPQFGTQNITATGDLFLNGTLSDYTAVDLNNTSGVHTQVFANTNANGGLATITSHPLSLSTNNTERMRVTADGNVGIGTTSPSSKLDINTASASFRVRDATGGNDISIKTIAGPVSLIGSQANTPIGLMANNTEFIRIETGGNVGIGTTDPTSALEVNGTVTATAFAGPLTGSASTVNNGAITAAKLDGAQTGTAPVYGVRAWVNFNALRDSTGATNNNNTARFIRSSGNVTSVTKTSTGKYTIAFTTAMPDVNYVVVCTTGSDTNPRFANSVRSSATTSSIGIQSESSTFVASDFSDNNVMVIG